MNSIFPDQHDCAIKIDTVHVLSTKACKMILSTVDSDKTA